MVLDDGDIPQRNLETIAEGCSAVATKTFLGGLTETAHSTTLKRRYCAI